MTENKLQLVAEVLIAATVGGYLKDGEPPVLSAPHVSEVCDTFLATNTTTTTPRADVISLNAQRPLRLS
jgi:hypothetical protein